MSSQLPKTTPPPTAWAAFAGRWPGHPFLRLDPLYALPGPLIDWIEAEAPHLLGTSGAEFERDLVDSAGGGFFLRRRFDCPLLAGPPDPVHAALGKQIHGLLVELMRDAGKSPLQVEAYLDREAGVREGVDERRLAYCTWLIADERYRAELDALRELGGDYVVARGGFPRLPVPHFEAWSGAMAEDAPLDEDPSREQQVETRFRLFYRRWGLDRLITWDLPCPMGPELDGLHVHDPADLNEAGVPLFLPWYLMRDRSLQLADLVDQLRVARDPIHLRGWLERGRGEEDRLGYARLANLWKLHQFWRLALASRYELKGQLGRLDAAFGGFLGRDAQSVRKLRADPLWTSRP